LDETAQDVVLHAEIQRHDVVARRPRWQVADQAVDEALLPVRHAGGDHLADEGAAGDAGAWAGLLDQRRGVEVGGGEHTPHGATDAEPADQGAGVDALQTEDAVVAEVGVEVAGGPVVADQGGTLADDEALDVRSARLVVLDVDAVVADERVGHADDLTLVGG